MKKTAVIFDMDGLMFDTQCLYDRSYDDVALRDYNFIVPREMHLAMMGSSGEDIIRTAARYLPAGADARAFIRECFDRVAELVKTELRARPGLDIILPYLAGKGYCLGLASGSERKVVDSNLSVTGLGHYFAATLCGDEVVHSKPDPEVYLRVASMIGREPGECYVLEDAPGGILAAYRAGCVPIMVPNDVRPDEAVRNMCAGVFDSLADVVTAMESGVLDLM